MPTYTPEVVRLNITTWVGTCALGEHWYGKFHWHMPKYEKGKYGQRKQHDEELEYVLSARDAERLDADNPYTPCYRAGDSSARFLSYEKLIERAQETWQQVVPHGKVLIMCDMCSCGPVEILVGPKKLVRLGNQVWKKWEESEANDKLCIQLERQWDALFKKAGFSGLTDR